jgi:hypothetical protein
LKGNKRASLNVNGTFIIDDNLINNFDGTIVLSSESKENIFYSTTQFNSDITFEGEGNWILNSSLRTKGKLQAERVNIQPEGNQIFSRIL